MEIKKTPIKWQTIAGLIGLIMVIILALVIPNSQLFKADFSQSGQNGKVPFDCQKIDAVVLPGNPIPSNTSAMISLNVTPEAFTGLLNYSASSGSFNDEQGNTGSYIQTSSKKVNYSG